MRGFPPSAQGANLGCGVSPVLQKSSGREGRPSKWPVHVWTCSVWFPVDDAPRPMESSRWMSKPVHTPHPHQRGTCLNLARFLPSQGGDLDDVTSPRGERRSSSSESWSVCLVNMSVCFLCANKKQATVLEATMSCRFHFVTDKQNGGNSTSSPHTVVQPRPDSLAATSHRYHLISPKLAHLKKYVLSVLVGIGFWWPRFVQDRRSRTCRPAARGHS